MGALFLLRVLAIFPNLGPLSTAPGGYFLHIEDEYFCLVIAILSPTHLKTVYMERIDMASASFAEQCHTQLQQATRAWDYVLTRGQCNGQCSCRQILRKRRTRVVASICALHACVLVRLKLLLNESM